MQKLLVVALVLVSVGTVQADSTNYAQASISHQYAYHTEKDFISDQPVLMEEIWKWFVDNYIDTGEEMTDVKFTANCLFPIIWSDPPSSEYPPIYVWNYGVDVPENTLYNVGGWVRPGANLSSRVQATRQVVPETLGASETIQTVTAEVVFTSLPPQYATVYIGEVNTVYEDGNGNELITSEIINQNDLPKWTKTLDCGRAAWLISPQDIELGVPYTFIAQIKSVKSPIVVGNPAWKPSVGVNMPNDVQNLPPVSVGTSYTLTHPDGVEVTFETANTIGWKPWMDVGGIEVTMSSVYTYTTEAQGTITGIVRSDSNGLTIANIQVYAFNYQTGNWCGGGSTNPDGFYSISDLAAGTYVVQADARNTNYATQYYDHQISWDHATPVVVPASGVVQDINFSLELGASISGVVKNSAGVGQANIQVNCLIDNGNGGNYVTGNITDVNGFYKCDGLPVGYNYNVVAYPPSDSNYVITGITVDVYQPGEYPGNDIVLGIGGSITGAVRDSAGLPIANIQVNAFDYQTGEWDSSDNTDSNGVYEITNLAAGTYRVQASVGGTQYLPEFYNNQLSWDQAAPVNVSAGQQTTGIDFSLELGASISGIVKNSDGIGQANIQVNCWTDNGYGTGAQTEANGFYKCDGLPVGYNYNVVAYPPSDSNYAITGISVGVYQPGEYTDKDIVLGNGFKISGRVTDKATGLPLPDIYVNCWNDDLQVGADAYTDANGIYKLTNLPPGVVNVSVEPDSYYAYMGIDELELEEDINNLDFALPAGAVLCGRVLDAKTAKPLAGIEIDYEGGIYNSGSLTNANGAFCLTQLPPGIAEVKAKPDVDTGYAWNLPWGSDLVCLNEGENRSGRIITLEKGALVRGHIKDADGNAISGIEYDYSGRDCDGWDDTNDVDGSYQIRLPVGIYAITPDNTDEFGALPAIVTITDVNEDVNVPDMIVYTEETGGQISGEVTNPGGYAKTGYFIIISFKAGTSLNDPNAWYTIRSIAETGMENAGPFSLNKLPPDANYDIYFCVYSETPDGIQSVAPRDAVLNVAVGTTGITLEYNSQGSTVKGTVNNTDGKPILGATAILLGSSGFGGFANTDCNGGYVIYNVPAGAYTATALHSKYLFASTTAQVVEGVPVDVNTIIMPFRGEKEGPDLNGDGNVDMVDVAEFAEQWLNSGASEADFNQDNKVNFSDWVRIAGNWMRRAIWLHE